MILASGLDVGAARLSAPPVRLVSCAWARPAARISAAKDVASAIALNRERIWKIGASIIVAPFAVSAPGNGTQSNSAARGTAGAKKHSGASVADPTGKLGSVAIPQFQGHNT